MSQRAGRVPPHGRWKEYGSECYWAGLVGALLAVVLVACSVGGESMAAARARSCARPRGEPAGRHDGLAGAHRLPGQGALEQALHVRGMDGLGQMRVEPRLPRMALILGQPIAGQGDEA
jgi:hypothetical protein